MEEADLLKERLQAITDKRRIREDIAKKRRQIEEEKLKLQYIKKKALREQWLMDGLSQQSEELQEAMRLQAQEQQQSDELQSNILRIEKEIEALETQELNISANEEAVLKRLKEVEKTPEDIIKELHADFQTDVAQLVLSPLADSPSVLPMKTAETSLVRKPDSDEPKKATFAMEINVELDKRTGKIEVVSTATVTPETLQERGLKVYDDGRKTVYALHPDGAKIQNGAVEQMTPTEVEELLRQAIDEKVPTEVQYHQPVYSVPYTGTSRPSTPRTPTKNLRLTPTPSFNEFQGFSASGTQLYKTRSNQWLEEQKNPNKTPSPSFILQESSSTILKSAEEAKLPCSSTPEPLKSYEDPIPESHFGAHTPREFINRKIDMSCPNPASVISVKVKSEEMPAPIQPVYRPRECCSPSLTSYKLEVDADPRTLTEHFDDFSRTSPLCAENSTSLNLIKALPVTLESESITMIFMGYENAEDEEENDVQAELVVVGNSDDDNDDDECVEIEDEDDYVSYHPQGYKSKVFQPKLDIAKVDQGCKDMIKGDCGNWVDLRLHKPTFIHKHGKHSPCLQEEGTGEAANTSSINTEKMKLT
ncbi:palmdelphin-like [Pholidichthys leucotaenia]